MDTNEDIEYNQKKRKRKTIRWRYGMKVAVITANTEIYRGNAENTSGLVIEKMVKEAGQEVVFVKALPCDEEVLSAI